MNLCGGGIEGVSDGKIESMKVVSRSDFSLVFLGGGGAVEVLMGIYSSVLFMVTGGGVVWMRSCLIS